ncbi:MAG: hypothetical protein AcusKO_13630 [Acuticoccus sp.]
MRGVLPAVIGLALLFPALLAPTAASAQNRTLELYFTHTKESIKVVYKRNGRYDSKGLRDLNRFLRDWRRNESTKMDPELFDLLWEMQREFGGKKIYVVSAYRSPATNAMLRGRSRGVAKNSQHMAGRAIDFYIRGANLSKLRAAGIKRQVGGVGYYPRSGSPFVHFDTGRVRAWPRMSYGELARIFPDGKTLHIASNGKTLSGYGAAERAEKAGKLASLRSGGGNGGGGGLSLFGFGGSGRQTASAGEDRTRGVLPPKQKAPEKPKKEQAKVRTASLGPSKTKSDDDDDDKGGFFRQLPGASLGGLIGRFTRDDADEEAAEEETAPVAVPDKPLTAVAVNNASDEIGRILTEDGSPPPVPRLAPAELRPDRGADDDGESADNPIVLAALPPQRPEFDGIASDAAGAPLGYARDDAPLLGGSTPLGDAAALLPQPDAALENAPLGELGAVRDLPARRVGTVPVLKTALSPVRGASPLLIADTSAIEDTTFADLTPPGGDPAGNGSVLLTGGFLGAPSGFASATNYPSTDSFTGLKITVYARPRS